MNDDEETKRAVPCALCKTQPSESFGPLMHPLCGCFPFPDDCIFVNEWNEMNARIKAQRKTDFEAGPRMVADQHGVKISEAYLAELWMTYSGGFDDDDSKNVRT